MEASTRSDNTHATGLTCWYPWQHSFGGVKRHPNVMKPNEASNYLSQLYYVRMHACTQYHSHNKH